MHHVAEPIHREIAAQPGTSGIGANPPSREDRTSAPQRYSSLTDDLNSRKPATAAFVPAARLEQRIAALRAEVAAAHLKIERINHAIASRKVTLFRLNAQLAMTGGTSTGLTPNE